MDQETALVLQLIIGALTIIASFFITRHYGDLAGAKYQEAQEGRRSEELQERQEILEQQRTEELRERLATAIHADIAMARRIAEHNITTSADGPGVVRPRPYIAFQTASYERLLFSGEFPELLASAALSALMDYLVQARHVNTMIGIFERMEAAPHEMGGRSVFPNRHHYIEQIGNYCKDDIIKHLDQLERELQRTPSAAST